MQQRNYSKRGFTLVELVVVLVIIGILLALVIPSLTSWIDRAKEKSIMVSCRSCVNAAQTLVAETYGATGQATAPAEGNVKELASVSGSVSNITLDGAQIATLTYSEGAEFATYESKPTPHYTYGTGMSIGEAAKGMMSKYNDWKKENKGANRSIYSMLEEAYKNPDNSLFTVYGGFFDDLPNEVKNSLSNTTWTIDSSKHQLYVYDGKLTDSLYEKYVDVKIYKLTDPSAEPTDGKCYVGTATAGKTTVNALTMY